MNGAGVCFQHKTILQGIDLAVEPGQFWGIAGPNGSGKTTLIRLITGFQRASIGSVRVLGRDIGNWRLHELRKRIGYLPQHVPFDEGFPISAGDLVLTGRAGVRGLLHSYTRDDHRICREAAEELGIEHLLSRPLGTLSGGERQLTQLARALAQQPELLILDEPTNNLDPRAADLFMEVVERLHRDHKLTVIMITHEISILPPSCGHVALICEGALAGAGPSDKLLNAETLGKLYGLRLTVQKSAGRYYIMCSEE
jgi:ABC-type cobalamin/Fe3+-siderophores transport system ATPase subunit